jgi:hypothetical protein
MGAMTTAPVSTTETAAPRVVRAALGRPVHHSDALEALPLVLDRELISVRQHDLELAGRVPERAAHYVDRTRGMLELVMDDGAGGAIVLAVAPGARGDTVVPVLPAPAPDPLEGREVGTEEPFAAVLGEAVEDVSRILTHVEVPDEMRGLVLHLGGRMLVIYADLWELRATLLP